MRESTLSSQRSHYLPKLYPQRIGKFGFRDNEFLWAAFWNVGFHKLSILRVGVSENGVTILVVAVGTGELGKRGDEEALVIFHEFGVKCNGNIA